MKNIKRGETVKKRKKKEITQYFERKIRDELNVLDVTILRDIRIVKEKASAKGVLRSGETLGSIEEAIINNVIDSCTAKLQIIDDFQDYMRFNISEEQLNEIEHIYTSYYVPFAENKIERTYLEEAKALFGDSELNIVERYKLDNLIQKLNIMIQNKIEDVKIKNRLQKDEPSVRLSKYSNTISLISLIVAIISVIITSFLSIFR